MWFFRRDKYEASSRELELSAVNKLNLGSDLTLETILHPGLEPVKSHRKEFCSLEKMKTEIALNSFYNEMCPIADSSFKTNNIYRAGFDDAWFIETDHLGEQDDFKSAIVSHPDDVFEITAKCIDTAAVMKAVEPYHLMDARDMKKHSMYKPHRGVSKYINTMKEDGVKTNKRALRKAVNALEPLLGEWFDNDIWLGNFFDGRKIDEDKSVWGTGMMDVPHLIEETFLLDSRQREQLKERFFQKYNASVKNFNKYVMDAHADTKGTVLKLMDKYLSEDKLPDNLVKTVAKIKKKIERKKPKTFDQYLKLFNKRDLRDNIHMIETHINNLEERPYMTWQEFDGMYQSAKVIRCLSSYGYMHKQLEKAEKDSFDELYYSIAKQDQLEKAVDAAGKLEKYTSAMPKINYAVSKMKSVLEADYERAYTAVEEPVKTPLAEPRPLEKAVLSYAA